MSDNQQPAATQTARPRLMVTNDDGVGCDGIHVLAAALADAGYEVMVVAPDRDFSGAAASLGRIMSTEAIAVGRVEGLGSATEVWAVDGAPALCVLAAQMGAFGPPPDIVVSGINAGLNTGRAVLHSGTVGAALTAQNFGLSGLAVSTEMAPEWQWDTAADLALEALAALITYPPRSVLNLNVPALARSEIKGLRWGRLASFGEVQTSDAQIVDDRLQFTFRGTGAHTDLRTDQGLVAAGYASLTALAGIAEAWPSAAQAHEHARRSGNGVEAMAPGVPFHPVHDIPAALPG